MESAFSDAWLTNGIGVAALIIFVGFVGKQVIDWFRGNKKAETEFRSTTITDAIKGHELLKDMFERLKEQVEGLETELQEAKERETLLVSKHEEELNDLRTYYESKIQELRDKVTELETRLNGGDD